MRKARRRIAPARTTGARVPCNSLRMCGLLAGLLMPSWRTAFPLTRKRNKFWIRRVALACCMCVWVLLTPRGFHSSYRDITCLHCVVNQVDDNKDGKIDGSEMKWGHKHIGPLTHPHYDF